MVDEKDKDNEVVGLDEPATTPPPPQKASGIKKYIIPFAIGGGIFLSAMIIPSLLFKKAASDNVSQMAGTTDSTKALAKKSDSSESAVAKMPEESLMADLSFLDIDTVALMKELGFLGFDSAAQVESTSAIARDSLDTLNWIEKEMSKLAGEKASVDSQKQALDSLNTRVTYGLSKIEQAETTRLGALAKLYDSMKPNEVVKLFENLDDSLIVQILPKMKPVNAAKVLALMPPKRAAMISTQLISIAKE